jgi:hypothetical protein
VQHHAADQLHVEVAHLHRAPAGLANDGKGLRQDLVESFALRGFQRFFLRNAFEAGGNSRAEFYRFGTQLLVGKLLDLRLHVADGRDHGPEPLDNAFVRSAKYLC